MTKLARLIEDQPLVQRITRNCRLCQTELHLVQDSSGNGWYHARVSLDQACWDAHRAEYEQAGCEL
jgi:hypothetical protein